MLKRLSGAFILVGEMIFDLQVQNSNELFKELSELIFESEQMGCKYVII